MMTTKELKDRLDRMYVLYTLSDGSEQVILHSKLAPPEGAKETGIWYLADSWEEANKLHQEIGECT